LTEEARSRIENLFRRYASGVSRYALLRVRSPELAEEITARVFLAVVRHIDQQSGSLVGWLWAIVRSELARHYRQPAHQAFPPGLISTEAPPGEDLERQERDRLLLDALEKLPDDLQQLISLKFFLNASNLDIAAALELTPSNVGVKVHRALKELRRRLEPEFFWSES
jgi:RNA polymerase sigma-70 factor (ECF subfamily)